MKYVALIFFILGMITYVFIPKDVTPVEAKSTLPVEKAIYYDEAGNHCVIYAYNPATRADCEK